MVFVEVCCERRVCTCVWSKAFGNPLHGHLYKTWKPRVLRPQCLSIWTKIEILRRCLSMFRSHVLQGRHCGILREMMNQLLRILIRTQIFPHVGFYLKLGDFSSFELPWRNEIWKRVLIKETLRKAGHLFDVQVHLCATGFRTASGKPVGKSLGLHLQLSAVCEDHEWTLRAVHVLEPARTHEWSELAWNGDI